MRTVEGARKRWDSLFDRYSSLGALKDALGREDADSPAEDGLRSVCWKAFLVHRTLDTQSWPSQISDSRSAYTSLRDHFLKYIEHPDDIPSTADPLADDEEEKSPWQELRRDETLRAEIYQDVERCLQENYFFREPTTKARMLDILFIFSKLNPDLGYRQGMHELLAPVLWVVEHDAMEKSPQFASDAADTTHEVMLQALDPAYIEHDSFAIFCAIMQTAKLFYEHEEGKSAGGQQDVSPIVARSQRIHHAVLKCVDPELADHLLESHILPQIFLIRWIRLLFGREFAFHEVLGIWDVLFSEDLRLSLVDMVCVAMLLRIRWQLLEADYSSALALVLRYPHPDPYKPASFVHDGIYLERNLNPDGAAFLTMKYLGKVPKPVKPGPTPSQSLGASFGHRRSHSRGMSAESSDFGTPSVSPVRSGQRRLDSLFQDVSAGLQRRGEGWGVAKAVRGAMVEARRNIQNIQSTSSSPGLRRSDSLSRGPSPPPRIDFTEANELSFKISSLEDRNKSLAAMLEDALKDLRTQHEENKDQTDASRNIVDHALARLQFIQVHLENSTMPLPEEKYPAAGTSHNGTASTGSSVATRAASHDRRATQRTSLDTLPERKVAEVSEVAKPVPLRPSVRAPLAESSFSWMLGENQNRSGFVSSASAPPEDSRGRGNQSHGHQDLFGDGRRTTSTEDNGVAMNKLRGASRR